MHSPSIDMSNHETLHTLRIQTDYMFDFTNNAPLMNDAVRPAGLPMDTPEISALLSRDVGRLPPQLIYYSTTEVLASDAERWAERSKQAGVVMTEHKKSGQLHTYSLGWPFVGSRLQQECDELLINFIFCHVEE